MYSFISCVLFSAPNGFRFSKNSALQALSKLARWLIIPRRTLAGEINEPMLRSVNQQRTREHGGKIMADDMKNQDLNKNMGGSEQKGGQQGQQSPGRNPQDDQSTGQRGGQEGGGQSQKGGQQGGQQGSQQGGQKSGQQGGQQSGQQGGQGGTR